MGGWVKVRDLQLDEEEVFHLVGDMEVNYDENKIPSRSLLAQALLGTHPGETVSYQTLSGVLRMQVVETGRD